MASASTLENGIRILTESAPGSRSISLGVLIGASPQDDPAEQLGLAHVAEHALFLGTRGREGADLYRMMDSAGGQMGAFTARDYTCVYADILDEYVTYAMELVGDILVNTAVPEDDLEQEKSAIQREIDLVADSPYEQLNAALKSAAWGDHPLGRPVHGTKEGVDRIHRDDVLDFFSSHYTPDSMIVSASGNVDHDHFVELCQDALWSLQGTARPETAEPCRQRSTVSVIPSERSQAYFSIALPAFEFIDSDRYPLFVLSSILGGGLRSRLFRELRERRGLVYSIGSEIHAYRDGGMLCIEGAASPEQLMTVISTTVHQLFGMLCGELPIDEEELVCARMKLRGQHLLAAEHLNTSMSRLATQEFYFGKTLPEGEIAGRFESVQSTDLERVSYRLLPGLADLAIAVTGPDTWTAEWNTTLNELVGGFSELRSVNS